MAVRPAQYGEWMMSSVHVGLIDLFAKKLRWKLAPMRKNSHAVRHTRDRGKPQIFIR